MKNRELAIQGKGLPNSDFWGHFFHFFQLFFLIFQDLIFQMVQKKSPLLKVLAWFQHQTIPLSNSKYVIKIDGAYIPTDIDL